MVYYIVLLWGHYHEGWQGAGRVVQLCVTRARGISDAGYFW